MPCLCHQLCVYEDLSENDVQALMLDVLRFLIVVKPLTCTILTTLLTLQRLCFCDVCSLCVTDVHLLIVSCKLLLCQQMVIEDYDKPLRSPLSRSASSSSLKDQFSPDLTSDIKIYHKMTSPGVPRRHRQSRITTAPSSAATQTYSHSLRISVVS